MSDILQDPQLSNSLSMYEIDSPMGRGAGSFVYKVKNRKTKQFAALKVIEKKGPNAEKVRQRIQNEIDVHSTLNHQNIVQLLAHFEDEDNYYLLMELCEGGELYNLVKQKGRLNDDEVRNYGLQFAKALKYMHTNKVLHRDLKLSNLLLTGDKALKVCDFGLAVKLTDLRPERDTICGTPNYISPEIIKQEPYGIKADTWAFGCILYAMATGSPPFEGNSVKETLAKVQTGSFALPKDMSPHLYDLLKNLINKDPTTRFDIGAILEHPFFIEPYTHASIKTKNLPLKLSISHSMSFGDQNSPQLETDTKTFQTEADEDLDFNFDLSSNSYVQRLIRQQQQKSASAASTPLFRRPITGVKAPASQFAFAGVSPESDNKENFSEYSNENGTQTQSNGMYNQRQEYKRRQKAVSKSIIGLEHNINPQPELSKPFKMLKESLALNSATRSDDLPNHKPLRMLDLNIKSNFAPRNFTPSTGIEAASSACGDEDRDSLQHINRNMTPLTPLSTQGLKPTQLKIKGGTFEVTADRWISIDLANSKRKINISPDGIRIQVEKCTPFRLEKTYTLSNVPSKYLKFYTYASQVCDTMRTRVPRIKVEDSEGKFYLTKSKASSGFEGRFVTGEKVTHLLSSKTLKVQMVDGRIYEINVLDDFSHLGERLSSIVKKSLEKMNLCIEKGEFTK